MAKGNEEDECEGSKVAGPTGGRVGKKAAKNPKRKVSHTSQNTVRANKISQPKREVKSEIKSEAEENEEDECVGSEEEYEDYEERLLLP